MCVWWCVSCHIVLKWQRHFSHQSQAKNSQKQRNFYALPFSICKAYGFHQIIINHLYHGRFWDDAPSLTATPFGRIRIHVFVIVQVQEYTEYNTLGKKCVVFFCYLYIFPGNTFTMIHENSLYWHIKGFKVDNNDMENFHVLTFQTLYTRVLVLIIHLIQFNIITEKNTVYHCFTNSSVFVSFKCNQNTSEEQKKQSQQNLSVFFHPSTQEIIDIVCFWYKTNEREKKQSVSATTRKPNFPATASISSFLHYKA